jgi:hypothetical protein
MLGVDCQGCGQHFPLAETAMVKERYLCKECTKKAVEAKDATWEEVGRNVDATLCFRCKKDNGEHEFEKVAGLGACPECTKFLRNRPFPNWVKMAMAGMLLLALAAGLYNWRFADAYIDLKAGRAAADEGEFDRASLLMESAARSVPESQDLKVLSHFYKGLDLYKQEKGGAAYAEFSICCEMEPQAKSFVVMRDRAAQSKAFDEKNYEEFLRLTLAEANRPGAVDVGGMLASAYACMYASTHQEQYKASALENLKKAEAEWGAEDIETYPHFADRITHRIETGEVITRKVFAERYPNGYAASKEK